MRRSFFCFAALAWALLLSLGLHAVEPSGTLPVMYINTENNSPVTSKTEYLKATYYLDPMNVEGVSAIGSASEPLELQIRGRGNYTWSGFDKKPYRLKLGKKQKLLGMDSSKHWALLAHADDNRGFLRNTVGFQLSRLIDMPWTPGDAPIEVVLNGDYIGLYFLTETVRVDKNRVNVWDYDSEYEDYEKAHPGETLPWEPIYATGGWLCEIDNYVDEDQVSFTSTDPNVPDHTMRVTYDTPSDYITPAHKDWLLEEFVTMDRMIVSGDRANCEWKSKIDLVNLAKFFIVNQIVFNYEAFHGSCKLWREQGEQTLWNFGPVWDFGSAFQYIEDKMLYNFGPYSNHWIKCMNEYPELTDVVKQEYAALMDGEYDTIDSYIDNFINKISAAAACDKQRWPQYGNSDLSASATTVKNMLRQSTNYLNRVWEYDAPEPDPEKPSSDIYLRGEVNGWDALDEYRFTPGEGLIYTLHLDKLPGQFKLAGPVWSTGNVDFGGNGNGTVDLASPFELKFAGKNLALTDQEATDLTFTFNWYEKTLLVTTGGDASVVLTVAPESDAEYFTLQGVRINTPTVPGIYIRRTSRVIEKILVR